MPIPTEFIGLAASPAGGGTLTGSGFFLSGSIQTISTTPNPGFTFVSWATGSTVVSTTSSYTLQIPTYNQTFTASYSVGATFYSLTASASPSAGGNVTGSGLYTSGAPVTASANTSSGYLFVNWTSGSAGNVVSTNPIYSFTINNDTNLTASFLPAYCSITASAVPSGGGTISGSGLFLSGSTQTVYAITASGYGFTNWKSGSTILSTSPNYSFVLANDTILTANFTFIPVYYSVTASLSITGSGVLTGQGLYLSGSLVTVTATDNAGFQFVNWESGSTVLTTNAIYAFDIANDTYLVADFIALPTGSDFAPPSGSGYVQVLNENYGYAVTTFGDYVGVSDPAITRWTPLSASVKHTGSVDYFRYNKSTDEHDLVGQLYLDQEYFAIILTAESGALASLRDPLLTELNNPPASYNDYIEIDKNLYTSSLEDGFGTSLDMYGKLIVVGCPYSLLSVETSASIITASMGAIVDIFDLSLTEQIVGTTASAFIWAEPNPDTNVTNSYGTSVAINASWMAVGSPYSGSTGTVYIYANTSTGSVSGSIYQWTQIQQIQPSGSSVTNPLFGWSIKLNKQSGSYSGSLVVGCGNPSSNQVFYFEFISGSWQQTFIFQSDLTTEYPLTFGNYIPYINALNIASGYGFSVSTFQDTVVVGEYLDRNVSEFSGSLTYKQGSVSVYQRCNKPGTLFELVLKTYGTSSILKNNLLGYAVDIYGTNIVAGIPKINNKNMSSCYVGGTMQQLNFCGDEESALETTLHGQILLIQQNTSSNEWGITNIYQRKKRFFSPYRCFGDAVAAGGRSMVVGAPMTFEDSNRQIQLTVTESSNIVLDDVAGKAYIYNFANLWNQYHVGNVFYRNGKIILMTSGSVYDGLFHNPINTNPNEYDMTFTGQHTIFEKQVVCSVNPGEFNVSTNPTAIFIPTSSFDINGNGVFDFQDVDVILRYMQYKNTSLLGVTVSTNWSSSIVLTDDEKSVLRYYQTVVASPYDAVNTSILASESIVRWETSDAFMQTVLDLNHDNQIDVNDMYIMWKYFTNRLTQTNYDYYITANSQRKLFSAIMDYMSFQSRRAAIPQIKGDFELYEESVATDKTGSFLAPTATTIGLYSGLDLVMVAKLGSPIKITPELPINFVVKMDY
jgi:hypothetical protein